MFILVHHIYKLHKYFKLHMFNLIRIFIVNFATHLLFFFLRRLRDLRDAYPQSPLICSLLLCN